jgi:ABC-type multidrug transport system ATPase subunit
MISKKNQGKTILHATHNLNKLVEFSDRILLIDHGRIISLGEPEGVLEKYKELRSS